MKVLHSVAILVTFTAGLAFGQVKKATPAPPAQTPAAAQGPVAPVTLSADPLEKAELESEVKDLVILQLQYQNVQSQMQNMQAQFQAKNAEVEAKKKAIKENHKWGDDVTYDLKTGNWVKAPGQPTTPLAK